MNTHEHMYIHSRTIAASASNEYNCTDVKLTRHPYETPFLNEDTNKEIRWLPAKQAKEKMQHCCTVKFGKFSKQAEGKRKQKSMRLSLVFSPCHWTGSLPDLPFIHNLDRLPPPFPPSTRLSPSPPPICPSFSDICLILSHFLCFHLLCLLLHLLFHLLPAPISPSLFFHISILDSDIRPANFTVQEYFVFLERHDAQTITLRFDEFA